MRSFTVSVLIGWGVVSSMLPAAGQTATYEQILRSANSLISSQQFQQAADEAKRAIRMDGNRFEGYVMAATAYQGLKLSDDAIGYLQQALVHAPDDKAGAIREMIAKVRDEPASPRVVTSASRMAVQGHSSLPEHTNSVSRSSSPETKILADVITAAGKWVFEKSRAETVAREAEYCVLEVRTERWQKGSEHRNDDSVSVERIPLWGVDPASIDFSNPFGAFVAEGGSITYKKWKSGSWGSAIELRARNSVPNGDPNYGWFLLADGMTSRFLEALKDAATACRR